MQVLPGSASCEQIGGPAAARAANANCVMAGSLGVSAAWGCRCSDAAHKDNDMSTNHSESIDLASKSNGG